MPRLRLSCGLTESGTRVRSAQAVPLITKWGGTPIGFAGIHVIQKEHLKAQIICEDTGEERLPATDKMFYADYTFNMNRCRSSTPAGDIWGG
jgi:hypothetical protein